MKNLRFLENKIIWIQIVGLLLVVGMGLFLRNFRIVWSAILGSVAGYLVLDSLISSLERLKERKGNFFRGYVLRYGVYFATLYAGLKYKLYFNFGVLLLFLFFNQVLFIVFSSINHYKRIKALKNG